jgi:Arc/MetJ family transcription regulator
MPLRRGRPRTRPPVRRVTLELDAALLDVVERAAGESPLRAIVETALQAWLVQPGIQQLLHDHMPTNHGPPADTVRAETSTGE